MLWHIVHFRFRDDLDDDERVAAEDDLRKLADAIPEIRLLRVVRSVNEPDVTGLITAFEDEEALALYADHPDHVPVARRIDALCAEITRLDVITADMPDAFPRLEGTR